MVSEMDATIYKLETLIRILTSEARQLVKKLIPTLGTSCSFEVRSFEFR